MPKLIVFLSHIHEEAGLAALVKGLIEEAFLGLAEVFVSSDPSSIAYGQKWLDDITTNLRSCSVELILCSPESIKRPWVNFEAGAGWVRDIPVIPLCHSGLDRSKLPVPLSLLQAANAVDAQDMRGALGTIASALGSTIPKVDVGPFIVAVKDFAERYTFWNQFDAAVTFGKDFFQRAPAGSVNFTTGTDFQSQITETGIAKLRAGVRFLLDQNLLRITSAGDSAMTPTGTFYGMNIAFSDSYRNAVNNRPNNVA